MKRKTMSREELSDYFEELDYEGQYISDKKNEKKCMGIHYDLPEKLRKLIFEYADEEEHGNGYFSVFARFTDICDIVEKGLK